MPARRNTWWTFLLFSNLLIIIAAIIDLVLLLLHPGLVFLLWFLFAAGEGIEGPTGFVLLLCGPRRRWRWLRRRVRRMRSRLSVGAINFPDAVVLIDCKATLMVAILEQLLQLLNTVDAQVRLLVLHSCHAVFHRSPALCINVDGILPIAVLENESQQTGALLILASPMPSLESPGLGLHILLGLRSGCRLLPVLLLSRSSRSISATLKPPPRRGRGSCGLPIVRLARRLPLVLIAVAVVAVRTAVIVLVVVVAVALSIAITVVRFGLVPSLRFPSRGNPTSTTPMHCDVPLTGV
mmetsp:Transcript_60684/g.144634  ORF Transcript_60684/g.144634 Transcript_60684/m.144634 type:complete len:295 (+) Transcript_60684:382-1266(+)